jgi:hypothetical protein
MTVVSAFRQASLGDRILLGFVALSLLSLPIARPIWRVLDPPAALAEDCADCLFGAGGGPDSGPSDPWGRPFVFDYNGDSSASSYRSFGPNGVDDDGAGDDISVWGRQGFASNSIVVALVSPAHVVLRFFLLLLSSLLVGVRLLWWAFHRKRSEELPMEVACSAVLAVPLALVLAPPAVLASGWLLGDLARPLEGKLLTPFPVAVAGVVYGLCALFVLYCRVERKGKAEPI